MYPRGAGVIKSGEARPPLHFNLKALWGQGRDGAVDPEADTQFDFEGPEGHEGHQGAAVPEGSMQAAIQLKAPRGMSKLQAGKVESQTAGAAHNFMTPGDTPGTGAVCSDSPAVLCLAAKAPSRDLPPSHDPSPFTAGDHPPPPGGDGRARSQPPTREEFFPGNSPHPGPGQRASFHSSGKGKLL